MKVSELMERSSLAQDREKAKGVLAQDRERAKLKKTFAKGTAQRYKDVADTEGGWKKGDKIPSGYKVVFGKLVKVGSGGAGKMKAAGMTTRPVRNLLGRIGFGRSESIVSLIRRLEEFVQ